MVVVLVNPQTKKPTCYEPPEGHPHYFSGPYQNVAEVTEEWQAHERDAQQRIFAAVAAEREACAEILDGFRLKWTGYDFAAEFVKAAHEIRARGPK